MAPACRLATRRSRFLPGALDRDPQLPAEDSRGDTEDAPKVSGEMSLIMEACFHGGIRRPMPLDEQASGMVDATADDVLMRGDAVGLREHPHQVTGVSPKLHRTGGDGERLGVAIIK